jgi:uncharacterized protein (TIGR02145 family)
MVMYYISAQTTTIELSFYAQDVGQIVPLDSILIENITQGGDTTLYAPDTVLLLDFITGMDELSKKIETGFELSQNFPNPIKEKTEFKIYVQETETVYLSVYDLTGRMLDWYTGDLDPGEHTFRFFPGRENVYLLTAQGDRFRKTIKMINDPTTGLKNQHCRILYLGDNPSGTRHKHSLATADFPFSQGDLLIYTAYTPDGERKISDKPLDNQVYAFQYSGIPCPGTPYVYDVDGNVYNTVRINTQCWMKENLKTTSYQNGQPISHVADTLWPGIDYGAYVWYNNNPNWSYAYGALYNWFAVENSNGLCPEGWAVPDDDQWEALESYVTTPTGISGGEALKSCRKDNYSNGAACNTSLHPRWAWFHTYHGMDLHGFSAVPGGTRLNDGSFDQLGFYSYWWSAPVYASKSENASFWYMFYTSNHLNSWLYNKHFGFSIRCIRVSKNEE